MNFMRRIFYSEVLNAKNDAYKTMTKILFKNVITKIPFYTWEMTKNSSILPYKNLLSTLSALQLITILNEDFI